jgi:hypothetical protein
MSAAVTLFRLDADAQGLFDGSVHGITIAGARNVKPLPGDGGLALNKGLIDVARNAVLDGLQTFTIEATVKPAAVGGTRQNITESQTPPMAFFIESNGKLTGSVHTAAGWQPVDSGTTLMKAGVAALVTFTRDATGKMELLIDGKSVGTANVAGPLTPVGALGFRVGASMDGDDWHFNGALAGLSIRQGVVTQQFFEAKRQEASRLEAKVKEAGIIKQIAVSLLPDESHARLQHVKDIMNAAGVQRLSDLGTLPVKAKVTLTRGTILVAPKKTTIPPVVWGEVAKNFRAATTVEAKRLTLATRLVNRNSASVLKNVPVQPRSELPADTQLTLPPVVLRTNPALRIAQPLRGIGEVKFLKGKGNGGLATGFCTSLASLVTDRFWLGRTDTPTVQKADVHRMQTAIHGKLLSRQSLLHFHDQGREGIDRVEQTYREIESTLLRGCDRQNAPPLFYIPAGEVWDSGYFDKLSSSHCVMPFKLLYPTGRALPTLTPDGSSSISDPDGVQMFVWDCNKPTNPNCRLVFRRESGKIHYDYFPDDATPEFRSTDGITLGMMRHGDYMLADHDPPFNGPFGLTAFVIDFLLSPADLQVTDENGLRTGNFNGQLRAEIPGSHLCYLAPGAYLLPANTALSRNITGSAAGQYSYCSLLPDGGSILIEKVVTAPGHIDQLHVNADGTQVRFTPAANKSFDITLARLVNGQSRAMSIKGAGAAPGAAMDLTVSPELSMLRLGNRSAAATVEVHAFALNRGVPAVNKQQAGVQLPTMNDLAVTVTDWTAVDLAVQIVPFE